MEFQYISNKYFWAITTSTTTPGKSKSGSTQIEVVLYILQISRTRTLSHDENESYTQNLMTQKGS